MLARNDIKGYPGNRYFLKIEHGAVMMMYGSYCDPAADEESVREEELEEAERMIRNGAAMRHIMRKQFTTLGQSDIYKLYRKYGMDPSDADDLYGGY